MVGVEVSDENAVNAVEKSRVLKSPGGAGPAVEQDSVDKRATGLAPAADVIAGPGSQEGEVHVRIPNMSDRADLWGLFQFLP